MMGVGSLLPMLMIIKETPIVAMTPKYRLGSSNAGETNKVSKTSSISPRMIMWNVMLFCETPLLKRPLTLNARETPDRKTKVGAQ